MLGFCCGKTFNYYSMLLKDEGFPELALAIWSRSKASRFNHGSMMVLMDPVRRLHMAFRDGDKHGDLLLLVCSLFLKDFFFLFLSLKQKTLSFFLGRAYISSKIYVFKFKSLRDGFLKNRSLFKVQISFDWDFLVFLEPLMPRRNQGALETTSFFFIFFFKF